MGGSSSADRRSRQSHAAGNGTTGNHTHGHNQTRTRTSDNQPQLLTLDNQHVQYRMNPRGPVIFYVDRQQHEPPTSQVQQTEKIKNHATLLKHTACLVPGDEPSKYHVSFIANATVEAMCTIYCGVKEEWDNSQGLFFTPQKPALPHCICTGTKIPAEIGHSFMSSEPLDLKLCSHCLKYDETKPLLVPLVIMLQYEVPGAVATEDLKVIRQCHLTYCTIAPSSDSGGYKLKAFKQRLQLPNLTLFDLEDIYGGMGQSVPALDGETALVKAMYGDMDPDGDECVICMANERDTTVMPCRHMCLCGECAEVLRRQTNKCPICRTIIECLMTLKKEKS